MAKMSDPEVVTGLAQADTIMADDANADVVVVHRGDEWDAFVRDGDRGALWMGRFDQLVDVMTAVDDLGDVGSLVIVPRLLSDVVE